MPSKWRLRGWRGSVPRHNANIVHRWLREQGPSALAPQSQANAFVPVTLDAPASGPTPQSVPDIRVEIHRANTTIVVKWPLQGSAACAAWLREVVSVIRIDAVWLATELMDMRAGTDTALAYRPGVTTHLTFQVTHKRLVVVNNEIGFNEANIKAICSVGASSKSQDKTGYVGEKGIGLVNLDLRQITRIVRDGLIAALGQENRHLISMFWDTSCERLRGGQCHPSLIRNNATCPLVMLHESEVTF